MSSSLGFILRPFADALSFLGTPVHPTLFPYPWATTLHAARISLVYQFLSLPHKQNLSWKPYLTGFLLMSWGGALFSHSLLSLPPPQILSIHPYINYLVPHLLLTFVFTLFPGSMPQTPKDLAWIDLVLFPVDALLRVGAITGAVSMLSPSSDATARIHPSLPSSPFFHILLGAAASAGGGILATTLQTFTPNWQFTTPPFLRPGVGFIGLMDLWAGSVVAAVFSLGVGHPAFKGVVPEWLESVIFVSSGGEGEQKLYLSVKGAKALGALVMTVLFGYRAVGGWMKNNHATSSVSKGKGVSGEKEKGKKKAQ
ncbi:hypothetical protein D9758_012679 [Tetrapyrgos nigripes]|uniref:Uncharacterized protein n=1 Tax=Tetrapyrgos nigripes TaxID=182062 RepID=A0A8H5CXT3_9AGAR|nr:hypothetical protein D9758_012679 [Tetrapyrgos nigripes]